MNTRTQDAIDEARTFLEAAGALPPRRVCVLCGSPGDDMRRAGRRDSSHAAIRDGLRRLGFSVVDTGGMGDDFPDLVVGGQVNGQRQNWLIECKGAKTRIAEGQMRFADRWLGLPVIVARSLDEALAGLGLVPV